MALVVGPARHRGCCPEQVAEVAVRGRGKGEATVEDLGAPGGTSCQVMVATMGWLGNGSSIRLIEWNGWLDVDYSVVMEKSKVGE